MKNIYNYTIKLVLITFVLTTLGSCKKSFLEILPKGRIIASKTTDYKTLRLCFAKKQETLEKAVNNLVKI